VAITKLNSRSLSSGAVTTDLLASNAVTTAKIGVDVIVAEDIAANAITVSELAANAVTTVKVADGAITAAKLAADATIAKLSSAPSVGSEGTLYYNTTSNLLYASNGTAWQFVGNLPPAATGGTVTIPTQVGTSTFTYNLGLNFTDADTPDANLTYTLASGTLPAGAVLPTSGNTALTGTATDPSSSTTYNFVIRATDIEGASSTQAYTQVITAGPVATGGTITTDGGYKYHAFTSSGTFQVQNAAKANCQFLVVAGGGGGGGCGAQNSASGGGGAGGAIFSALTTISVASHTITIGAGGAGGPAVDAGGNRGVPGTNTVAFSNTAIGGGAAPNSNNTYNGSDRNGGSGAGGTGHSSSASGYPGAATSAQGNAGGQSQYTSATNYPGGGGGGKGAAGSNGGTPVARVGGDGGDGAAWLNGITYAGGGGGGTYYSNALSGSGASSIGGTGGGGNGTFGHNNNNTGSPGTANTGGGGGGVGGYNLGSNGGTGGTGGSGIVIIRYAV
jgi:hypothetical protein